MHRLGLLWRRARAVRRRWVVLGMALAGVGAGSLAFGLLSAGASPPPSGDLQVRPGRVVPPGLYVAGGALIGTRGQQGLLRAAAGPMTEGPIAAASSDYRLVAYDTWRQTRTEDAAKSHEEQRIARGDLLGVPTLRVRDRQARSEIALEDGSFGAAWSSNGALAYTVVEGGGYHADTPILTKVVVRQTPGSQPVVWTPQASRYRIYGWAGDALIVVEIVPGDSGPNIFAAGGPGQLRLVTSGAGLLAISPDGKQLLLQTDVTEPGAAVLRAKDIGSGAETAALPFRQIVDPVTRAAAQWGNGPAHWTGDRILLSTDSGFAVLDTSDGQLKVEQFLHLDVVAYSAGSVFEARLADDLRTFVFWTGLPRTNAENQRSVQFVCDRIDLTCTRQPPGPPDQAVRPVFAANGGTR